MIEFLRITEADADKLVKDGVAWPAPGVGPQNLIELMQALTMAPPPPAPAPAPAPSRPATPPPPKEEPKPVPPPPTFAEQTRVKELESKLKEIEGQFEELGQAVKAKMDENSALEADRQRLEDEIAKQKSKTLLAERDAQERSDELIQIKGRKDKEATELEKERTKLKHEVDRQKRRADEALADMQKLVADHSTALAQIEQERDEAEASLARLVERQDRTKAEHESTMNHLVSRIQALESAGAAAPASPSDASGTRTLDKERNKQQSDLAFFRRQVEELVETARIKEEEHVRQMDSKIKELELLEEERDRYRDEVNAARAAADKLEARVSKPMSRAASRSASPAHGAPSTPEKKKPVRADSNGGDKGGEDLGWAQQQKQAVVEHLEKERARLEAELASQTRMAEEALSEAGTHRAALEQLRSSRATDVSTWDAERHRLEVELGSQATLAGQRARELDAEREVANINDGGPEPPAVQGRRRPVQRRRPGLLRRCVPLLLAAPLVVVVVVCIADPEYAPARRPLERRHARLAVVRHGARLALVRQPGPVVHVCAGRSIGQRRRVGPGAPPRRAPAQDEPGAQPRGALAQGREQCVPPLSLFALSCAPR